MSQRINKLNIGVYAVMLLLGGTLTLGSLVYDGRQKLVALYIGGPTMLMLGGLILAEVTPRLLKLTGAFGVSEDDAPDTGDGDSGGGINAGSWRRVFIVYGWLIFFYALTFVVGFYISIPLFLILFLVFESDVSPSKAVIATVVASIPLYVIFRMVLDIPLWAGILPRIIPQIIGGGSIPPLL